LLIFAIDASDEDEHEVASKEENVDETERKVKPDSLKEIIMITYLLNTFSASEETENKF
jgi:hypothetical protein